MPTEPAHCSNRLFRSSKLFPCTKCPKEWMSMSSNHWYIKSDAGASTLHAVHGDEWNQTGGARCTHGTLQNAAAAAADASIAAGQRDSDGSVVNRRPTVLLNPVRVICLYCFACVIARFLFFKQLRLRQANGAADEYIRPHLRFSACSLFVCWPLWRVAR